MTGRDRGGEFGAVQVAALVEQGVDDGKAERAAEIAGEVEQARRVLDPVGRVG